MTYLHHGLQDLLELLRAHKAIVVQIKHVHLREGAMHVQVRRVGDGLEMRIGNAEH